MKQIIFLFIVAIVLSFFSCGKEKKIEDCPKEFELPAQVSPYQSTYSIGDTIVLVSKFSKYVYEDNTKKTYNMENIIWGAGMRILRIDSSNNFEDALKTSISNYFSIISCTDTNRYLFSYSDGGDYVDAKYSYNKDSFNLSIELTPKKKGVFIITFGGGLDNSSQDFEGKCNNVNFNAYGFLNKGKDNNIDLLKESPMEHCNTWILQNPYDRFYKKRFYAFKVIE